MSTTPDYCLTHRSTLWSSRAHHTGGRFGPHHRPSISDNTSQPWPGLLVGGPNPDANTMLAPGATWKDSSDAYDLNEVAINWNAPLVYLSAALQVLTGPGESEP